LHRALSVALLVDVASLARFLGLRVALY
jgi:hypothetical protein